MSGQAIVFIESNTTGTGRLFARTARDMGFRPVLITARPERYAYLRQPDAPDVIVVGDLGEDALYRVLHGQFAAGREIAGVFSSSEYFIATAAGLAARLGRPGPVASCVRQARDKSWQRRTLAAGGLPTPDFRVAASPGDAVRAAREIWAPVVVKPLTGSGSVGVRACASAAEAGRHAASLLAASRDAREFDRPAVLVESLIEGPEVSVEVFSGQIVGITRKHLGAPPTFVEMGHDYPADLSATETRALTDVVTRGTELLGLGWGPLHWELRIRDGQAFPMEVNPRLAGGFIPELVRHATGVDLIRETLRLVVGQTPRLQPSRREHASIRFLVPPAAGRLVAIDGVDEARRAEGVVEVALYRSIGDGLTLKGDFRDRSGHVLARAPHGARAAVLAEDARDRIHFDVDGADAIDAAEFSAAFAALTAAAGSPR